MSLVETDKENPIQDNKEDTVTHRSSFSDRDQPKSELRHDLEKGTYGGESLSVSIISDMHIIHCKSVH